jgi:hypothetical protein
MAKKNTVLLVAASGISNKLEDFGSDIYLRVAVNSQCASPGGP